MDYMEKECHADYFSHYCAEDFTKHVADKRFAGIWGDHLEIVAMREIFNKLFRWRIAKRRSTRTTQIVMAVAQSHLIFIFLFLSTECRGVRH
jgi:hypothetical protein